VLLALTLGAAFFPLAGCEFLAEALNANENENENGASVEACTAGRCPDGQYCSFEEGTCDDPDRRGVCEAIPDVCAEIFDPVCGCDGVTYANECEAARAGESVDFEGECP
jgi:hypothetical protein